MKKLITSAKRLEKYAIVTTSIMFNEVAASPDMIANSTTPGMIIPIKAKDSINEAPMIPRAIH